jgi:exodeoxyribonuclease VII small subunit
MPKTSKKVEELSYEEAMSELDAVTAALEGENRPLDEMLALNERARQLLARCEALLEAAELKVRQLNGEIVSDFEGEA